MPILPEMDKLLKGPNAGVNLTDVRGNAVHVGGSSQDHYAQLDHADSLETAASEVGDGGGSMSSAGSGS